MRLLQRLRTGREARPALSTTYRDYTLYGLGLPSSGGIAVAEALNLLEAYDTATLTPVDPRDPVGRGPSRDPGVDGAAVGK
ncbi:hypothetical protein ACSRUE_42265 [Sorangium sp. KYC3313]|uniref:hypothetical protein n=1 Tax=Sorangium sp. KYC3313 TaxID=3449740 RepID=UPI003F8C1FBB